jgi:Predicted membrane protein
MSRWAANYADRDNSSADDLVISSSSLGRLLYPYDRLCQAVILVGGSRSLHDKLEARCAVGDPRSDNFFRGMPLAESSDRKIETFKLLNRREELMSIIGWILFGLVVGIVGKLLMPGRDPGGFIVTILLGIAGALLGGFVGQSLGFYREGEPAGFLMAVLGSIILLLLYRMFAGGRGRV